MGMNEQRDASTLEQRWVLALTAIASLMVMLDVMVVATALNTIRLSLGATIAELQWNLLVVEGQDLRAGFAAFQRVWGQRPNPPVITGAFVKGLAHPDFLVEMDAIAVVPT